MQYTINLSKEELIEKLWAIAPQIKVFLKNSDNLNEARN